MDEAFRIAMEGAVAKGLERPQGERINGHAFQKISVSDNGALWCLEN
jgi:hypothetical protein